MENGVSGVCEGVGPAVRMLRSWRLGPGGVDRACNGRRRREKKRVRCLRGGGASCLNRAIVASGARWACLENFD